MNIKKLFTDFDGKTSGIAFSLAVVLNILLSVLGQLILEAAGVNRGSYLFAGIGALFSVFALAITITIVSVTSKKGLLKIVRVKKFDPYYILPAIFLALGMFFGLGFLNNQIEKWFLGWGLKVSSGFIMGDSAGALILLIITVGILPPIFEEVFFRGLMVSTARKSTIISLMLTIGAMFAIYHASASQLAYQFIYGALLTLLVIKSGSVIPAIIAHMINNIAIIILEFLKVSLNFKAPLVICTGIVLLAGFVVSTLLLNKTKVERSEKCKNLWIFGSFGVLLCLLIAVLSLFI